MTQTPAKWGAGFAMVPGWLLLKKPTNNAVVVYIHLAMFGTFNHGTATYEQCRPSKKTLANGDERRGYPGTGMSESTVGRALRELEDLGAIRGEVAFDDAGGQLPNVYRLVFGSLAEEAAAQTPVSPVTPPPPVTRDTRGGRKAARGGDVTGDIPGVAPVPHNQEPTTQNPSTQIPGQPSADRRDAGSAGAADAASVQPTLDGSVPNQRATDGDETPVQRAFGIARAWIDYRAGQNKPVAGNNPLHQVKSLVLLYAEAGYTDKEIKLALTDLDTGIPSKQQLDRALVRVRTGGRPANGAAGNGRGGVAPEALRVNDHWDRVAATQTGQPVGAGATW